MGSSRGQGKRSKRSTTLDQGLHILNHPLRRRILHALLDGPASASDLAESFNEPRDVVAYHLNQVLAKQYEVVELVKKVPRRGALEKVYALKADAGIRVSFTSEAESFGLTSLEALVAVAAAAQDAKTFDKLKGSAWEWCPLEVDSQGWGDICDARDEFSQRVSAAVKDSATRKRERPGKGVRMHNVIVGVAAFPAASA